MAPSLVAFNIDLRGGAALFVVAPERGAVAAVVERARLPRGAAPARPLHASVLSSGVEGGLKRPLPASPPSLPSCSVLARSRDRACVHQGAHTAALSAALAEGAEDGWMELKTVEQ